MTLAVFETFAAAFVGGVTGASVALAVNEWRDRRDRRRKGER